MRDPVKRPIPRRPVARPAPRPRRRAGRTLQVIASIPAIAFACVAYAYLTLPDVRPLRRSNPETTAFIELRVREAAERGTPQVPVQRWLNYERISPNLTRAVLVAEDAAFWQHDGVDYDELQKSIEMDWARGQMLRGASTITQQLAKNLYLSPSRDPFRKFRELIIARRLEAELTKVRIFELYLNVIEWGDGIYGADAAARRYFGHPATTLGPAEAALLAGAIINPRLLSPAHPTPRLLRRQQIILKRMGGVTPPRAEKVATREPIEPHAVEPNAAEPIAAEPLPVFDLPIAPIDTPAEPKP
ncbi:MAG TPA: monofunctional biosynthetic peptidoglycan transglycosylase [Vicinamibacterales bacterium]|jgi:monofunctional biosynthetic peptidoglycan transglycosylase